MSRPVTADHVLFDESIQVFRNSDERYINSSAGPSFSYILPSFELKEIWPLPHCTLNPSSEFLFSFSQRAFICSIENPRWVGRHNSHLYGIALASIISFCTGKLCQSARDNYFDSHEEMSSKDLQILALKHPILTAGPGATQVNLPTLRVSEYQKSISGLMHTLYSVSHQKYVQIMQAIRLVHLSLLNKRDDFGLAYLLIVSAIESIAQLAVKREQVRKKHTSENSWSMRAKDDPDFKELLDEYKKLRGFDSYLKQRYIKFILTFAPIDIWEEIIPHPRADIINYLKETRQDGKEYSSLGKSEFEKYPIDLTQEEIENILCDSYLHRSYFVHRGEQPPHKQPFSYNRFFQDVNIYGGQNLTERLLPKYELLLGIAQCSITRWANTT